MEAARREEFVSLLRQDLRSVHEHLTNVCSELADVIQQRHTLTVVTGGVTGGKDASVIMPVFSTQLNLGCDMFVEARVEDTSRVLYHAGLLHYIELSSSEAVRALNVRAEALQRKETKLRDAAAKIRAHIKLVLMSLAPEAEAE